MKILMRISSYVRPDRIASTNVGLRLHADLRDFVQRRIYYFGVFEHGLSDLVLANVQQGDTVIDIGANVGYVSLLAATACAPSGRVVAIEADPETFKTLNKNLQLNPTLNIQTEQVAVTKEPCRVSMHRPDARNSGANAVRVNAEGEVKGLPLSQICTPEVLHSASFIKIDVEGAEGPILDELLHLAPAMSSRLMIVVEVHDHTADKLDAFRLAGFDLLALPNDYSIEHYRAQKKKPRAEPPFPVDNYIPTHHDYVLVRHSIAQ